MGYTEEQRAEFVDAVSHAVKWLHENGNPHMRIVVRQDEAVLVADELGVPFVPPD